METSHMHAVEEGRRHGHYGHRSTKGGERRRHSTLHDGSSGHIEEGERRHRGSHRPAAGEADSTSRRKGNAEQSASVASGIAGRMNRMSLASPTGTSSGDRGRNEEKAREANLLDLGRASSRVFESGLRAEAKGSAHWARARESFAPGGRGWNEERIRAEKARESFAGYDRGRNEEKPRDVNLLDLGRASSRAFQSGLRAEAMGSSPRARESFAGYDRRGNEEKSKEANLLDVGRASSRVFESGLRAEAKGSAHWARARESFAPGGRGWNEERIRAENLLDLGRVSSVVADQKIRDSERQRKLRCGGMTIRETGVEHGDPRSTLREQKSLRKTRRKKTPRTAF